MKRVLVGICGVALVVGASVAFMSPATTAGGAYINRDFGCMAFDGTGTLVYVDSTVSVVTSSSHTTLICSGNVSNPTGSTVIKRGFSCGTDLGTTNDSQNIVSPSGRVTLRCRI